MQKTSMSDDLERADSLISTRTAKSLATSDDSHAGHLSEHSEPFTPPWAAASHVGRLSEAEGKQPEDGRTSNIGTVATASDTAYASGDDNVRLRVKVVDWAMPWYNSVLGQFRAKTAGLLLAARCALLDMPTAA